MVVTHYRFDADVRAQLDRIKQAGFFVHPATYNNHPWEGWDGRSVDFWHGSGLGVPIGLAQGWRLLRYLWNDNQAPWIRHTIYIHQLRTSWAGTSWWAPNDHLGSMRHVHVTFWRPS